MKIGKRLLSLWLCFVMLFGLMPTSVFAAGTKLETPQNLKLQGTVLSWDAVDNADFYGITLYHPNYVYSIGSWQTDGTSINLYKYLKDGETYGATVIACSNGSYQISTPAEIPLTACTNAGVPIYRDVNVVNGTSSASTAYPGMSVRLEAKPAPDGMVFDRWELSGGYINIGYSDTDTVIYVQAICDNDISARATYKYQENVTSAFTVQPQGGAALVGKYFDVTYAMNFTPQGTVKVQVEGNTPGDFTDLKQGEIDSASIKEDSVVTKTFRIMASDGTRNIYSDEFVVSWEDGPRFISQPMGGTVDHNVDFVATYALNFTPFSCRVERYSDYLYQWVDLSNASATEATINSYDFDTSSNYRIKAIIQGGGEVYSDEFTVTWSDAVSKFIQQPVGGTVGFDEDFTFTFAINFTPASNIAIQKYNSGFDSWDTVGYCASLTSGTISGFASETTNKYRLEAYENGTPIHSNEFTVTWEGTDYTVSFAANGGSGTMADVNNVSGEYTLPTCGFTAPNGQRFKAWLVGGNEKAVGDKITVSANTVVTAVWENIPEYIVSYNANGGSGTMVGDMVTENGTFTLETCTYIAPEGYKFKAWAIGSVNGVQKQPDEQITITGETYIYAIWEAIEYNVTVTGGTASVGAGTPITKATMGTTVTLTAGAAPSGQMFDKWVVNGVVVADANSATTTFVMPAGEVTATATYKDIPVVTYTVTFDANGGLGSMDAATGVSGDYELPVCGFTAPNGKQFKAWSVGGVEKAEGAIITVNANTTVTAVWEDIPQQPTTYTVAVTNGSGSGDYTEGANVTITANAAPQGKVFDKWEVTGATVANVNSATTSFTMPANAVTATATYKDVPPQQPTATLTDIVITTPPTKTTYTAGESFDPTGMVVMAYYSDQSSRPLSNNDYTYAPAGALTANDTKITVTYNDGLGTIKTAEQAITVSPPQPAGHTHNYGQKPNKWDATHHWKECTDRGCPDCAGSIKDKAPHADSDGDGYCDDCDVEVVKASFVSNGGSGTMADVFVEKDANFTLPANGFTAPSGKSFKCWTVAGVEKAVGDKITVAANTTVTAAWMGNTYNPRPNYPIYINPTPGSSSTGQITAAKTFDGGIGLSVAVTILSAAGGAWLAKKKED